MSIQPEVDDVFEALKEQVTWLHVRWRFYKQLFGKSDTRIALLNESAAAFFYVIQGVMMDEVQIMLGKLTDPARNRQQENLTLEQLQARIKKHSGDASFTKAQRALLDTVQRRCANVRVHRHKRLAHIDLGTAMQRGATPLPGVSRRSIDEALQAIRDYMNGIQGHYDDSATGYEHAVVHSDGDQLVAVLKHALRYEELLDTGQIARDDFRRGRWVDA